MAIIYISKYGTTEEVVHLLSDRLKEKAEVTLFSLKENGDPDFEAFDTIILGVPVYAGSPLKRMATFCMKNEGKLKQKRLGLFICGMEIKEENRVKEFENAYLASLRNHAMATTFLGGAFLFEEMNFLERMIIKKIAKTTISVSRIDLQAMEDFAEKL